jgi:predicted secreted Zn-dependent protease
MITQDVRVQHNDEEFHPSPFTSVEEGVWRNRAVVSAVDGTSTPRPYTDPHVSMPDLSPPIADTGRQRDSGLPGHNFGHIQVFGAGMVEPGRAAAANSSSQTIFGIAPRVQRQPAAPAASKGTAKGRTHFEAVVHKTYSIEGATLDDAAAEIQQRTEAGSTQWNPTMNVVVGDDGTVISATVDVSMTMTMPQWPGANKLNKVARAEWSRFVGALKKHEDGHVTLVREQLKGLGESLVGMSQDDANAAFQAALVNLQTASDAYDDGNDHGRNEGTIIDTSAGSPTTP